MALKDEFAREDCFTVQRGASTLAIEESDRQVMLPWVHFQHAVLQGSKIELHFTGWCVEISGENLEELWKELQQHSVLAIRKSGNAQTTNCMVTSLAVVAAEEEKEKSSG